MKHLLLQCAVWLLVPCTLPLASAQVVSSSLKVDSINTQKITVTDISTGASTDSVVTINNSGYLRKVAVGRLKDSIVKNITAGITNGGGYLMTVDAAGNINKTISLADFNNLIKAAAAPIVTPPNVIKCADCAWNGIGWVDGYIHTNEDNAGKAMTWASNTTVAVGAAYNNTGSGVLNGRENTAAIVNAYADNATNNAATYCKSLGEGWYLPSAAEMERMYSAYYAGCVSAAQFTSTGVYWTSTENTQANAQYVIFTNGYSNIIIKTTLYMVRCMWRS